MVLVALSFVPLARGQQPASDDAVPVVSFEVNAFNVLGHNPLSAEQTQAVLADFTGSHNGLEGLLAAADALESALRKAGHAFYRVNLPGQTLQGGTVNLEVGEVPLTSFVTIVTTPSDDSLEPTSDILADLDSLDDLEALEEELLEAELEVALEEEGDEEEEDDEGAAGALICL